MGSAATKEAREELKSMMWNDDVDLAKKTLRERCNTDDERREFMMMKEPPNWGLIFLFKAKSIQMLTFFIDTLITLGGTAFAKKVIAKARTLGNANCITSHAKDSFNKNSDEITQFLCMKCLEFGGHNFLQQMLVQGSSDTNGDYCLLSICRITVPNKNLLLFMIGAYAEAGGREFLIQALNSDGPFKVSEKRPNRKPRQHILEDLVESITPDRTGALRAFCTVLYQMGLFSTHYESLQDKNKKVLKDKFNIDGSFAPS